MSLRCLCVLGLCACAGHAKRIKDGSIGSIKAGATGSICTVDVTNKEDHPIQLDGYNYRDTLNGDLIGQFIAVAHDSVVVQPGETKPLTGKKGVEGGECTSFFMHVKNLATETWITAGRGYEVPDGYTFEVTNNRVSFLRIQPRIKGECRDKSASNQLCNVHVKNDQKSVLKLLSYDADDVLHKATGTGVPFQEVIVAPGKKACIQGMQNSVMGGGSSCVLFRLQIEDIQTHTWLTVGMGYGVTSGSNYKIANGTFYEVKESEVSKGVKGLKQQLKELREMMGA